MLRPTKSGVRNGEGGIRTRGAHKGHTGFRNRLDRPLRHLSRTQSRDLILRFFAKWEPTQTPFLHLGNPVLITYILYILDSLKLQEY